MNEYGKQNIIRAVSYAAMFSISMCFAAAAGDEEKNAERQPPDKLEVEETSFQQIQEKIQQSEAAVSLVHVWATWCPPCRKEFPVIVKTARRYGAEKLNLILVSVDRLSAKSKVLDFLKQYDTPVGSLITSDPQKLVSQLPEGWGGGIPASFFYDKNGQLQEWWAGAHRFPKYKKTMEKLLKEGE